MTLISNSELIVTDRVTIQTCLSEDLSLRTITRWPSSSSSAISNEIHRNGSSGND
ncbi:hypothetical protein E0X81_12030 [Halomonas sp. GDM18]|nr:hypothetical protein E0X81_12030 [Halomonas sp. GDM18]